MNKLKQYFDLNSKIRLLGKGEENLHWLPQYIAVVLGVIVQPFLNVYRQTGIWNFDGLPGRVLFAVFIGIIIFPSVYKNSFDPKKPIFVQFCAIFVLGIGWESLLGSIAGLK